MSTFILLSILSILSIHSLNVKYSGNPLKGSKRNGKNPNFVILLLDDHGWGDVGCNNKEVKETPNIDRLAANGLKFNDLHSGASVCTPSRAALLTGRLGLRTGVSLNFNPFSLGGLPYGELTIADLLPENYTSHMVGKWHLGHMAPFHPSYRGFDTYFGLPYSGDMGCLDNTPQSCKPNVDRVKGTPSCPALCDLQTAQIGIPLYDTEEPNCGGLNNCDQSIIEQPVNEFSLNTRYAQRVLDIFDKQSKSEEPFFMYVAFAHTHTPLAYNETRFGNSSSRPGWLQIFGNGLAELDDSVGQILQGLEDYGLDEDTLVILAADNGPADVGSVDCDFIGTPGPYQGAWQKSEAGGGGGGVMKDTTCINLLIFYDLFLGEGGHRVVGIASWPGFVPSGVVSNQLVSMLDLAPTFISLAGGELPTDRSYDGMDISKVLLTNISYDRVLFHPSVNGKFGVGSLDAMRVGKYKLYWQTASGMGCNAAPAGRTVNYTIHLAFDLSIDPSESTPISVSDDIINEAILQYSIKMKDIDNTLRFTADMSTGDKKNSPCCNQDSNVCRCKSQPTFQQ